MDPSHGIDFCSRWKWSVRCYISLSHSLTLDRSYGFGSGEGPFPEKLGMCLQEWPSAMSQRGWQCSEDQEPCRHSPDLGISLIPSNRVNSIACMIRWSFPTQLSLSGSPCGPSFGPWKNRSYFKVRIQMGNITTHGCSLFIKHVNSLDILLPDKKREYSL